MKLGKVVPRGVFTFVAVVTVLFSTSTSLDAGSSDWEEFTDIQKAIRITGVRNGIFHITSLIDSFCEVGQCDDETKGHIQDFHESADRANTNTNASNVMQLVNIYYSDPMFASSQTDWVILVSYCVDSFWG